MTAHRYHRWLLRALPPLLVAVVVAPLAGPADAARAPAPQALAGDPAKPNVVLVLTDDQTTHTLSKMPYLNSQRWFRFDQAFVENGLCCPSRASILKGQYDSRTGVSHNANTTNFDPEETLATSLQRRGYRTALMGKYLNQYVGPAVVPGWNEWQVPYSTALYAQYSYPMSNNGRYEWHGTTPEHYQVKVLTDRGSRFIADSAAQAKPFFLLWTPSATHTPWKASPARQGMYAGEPVVRPASFNEADMRDKPAWLRSKPKRDPLKMDADRRLEMAAARTVDDGIAQLDASLKSAGVYDNTIVIFMTDNGYALGEHRWLTKRCAYDECLRTPLLVRYPERGVSGRDSSHLISNVDIMPTILQMTGATTPLPQDGRSFLPLVTGSGSGTPWRDVVLSHWPGGSTVGQAGKPDSIPQFWGARSLTEKYIELDTGEREFYDLVADPAEMVNQAANPAFATRVSKMKVKLDGLKAAAGASAFPRNASMPGPGELGIDLD